MRTVQYALLVGLTTFAVLPALAAQDSMQAMAGCESEAYRTIGVQPESRATIDYLETKAELVRVCMVRQGFRFRSEAWTEYARTVRQQVHESRGTWNRPSGDSASMESEREIGRRLAIDKMSYQWWQ